MRPWLQKLFYWTLPPGIQDSLIRFVTTYQGITPRVPKPLRKQIARNIELRNRHVGQRCFILATGPSIKSQDLRPLAGEVCLAVGDFYLHPDIEIIKPKYHCVAPYHEPFDKHAITKRFEGFERYYRHTVEYFLGHNDYHETMYAFLQKKPFTGDQIVRYINYSGSKEIDENNYSNADIWDISRKPFAPRTVIYIAIQVAVYMGFTKIYLLGVDHDYLKDVRRIEGHHFYPEKEGIRDAEHLSAFTLERWFEEYFYRWKQYRLMKTYLDGLGIQIFNSTKGSMLDVFPSIELSSIINV